MSSPYLIATAGEEGKKRKKIVVRRIVRKKKNNLVNGETKTTDGQYVPPTPRDEELENGTAVPSTRDSMDQYAEASCQLDALRLSQVERPTNVAEDSLASTLPDAQTPVVEVADSQPESIEHKLESFIDEHFDDRLKLPEEETLPNQFPENEHVDDGAHGSGAENGDADTSVMSPDGHPDNVNADRTDGDAPEPVANANEEACDSDNAWQVDKSWESWESRHWSTEWTGSWDDNYDGYWNSYGYWDSYGSGYGNGFGHGHGHGHGYWDDYMNGYGGYGCYGSWDYTQEQTTPVRPVQRSRSVESGLSELTSVSAIHAKMNRLDTPDALNKNADDLPASEVAEPLGKGSDEQNRVPICGTPSSHAASSGNDGNHKHEHGPDEERQPAEENAPGEGGEAHEGGEAEKEDDNEDRILYINTASF